MTSQKDSSAEGRKLSSSERKWIADYKRLTGFEAMMQRADLDAGKMSFSDFAYRNTEWLRTWVNETMQRLERKIP